MVRTPLPGTVPFGMSFDSAGRLALAEAGPNRIASFTLNRDDALTQIQALPTGQAGTCWIVGSGRDLYASNAGSGTLSRYVVENDGTLKPLGLTATAAGTVDAAISSDGRDLYVQTGAAGAVSEYQIQHDGSLVAVGSVTVPNAAGAEGIVAL
jgi:hypothetical protein